MPGHVVQLTFISDKHVLEMKIENLGKIYVKQEDLWNGEKTWIMEQKYKTDVSTFNISDLQASICQSCSFWN